VRVSFIVICLWCVPCTIDGLAPEAPVCPFSGLKRPAFYTHFRDRHDLALRVVQRIGQELFAMSDRWLQGEDPEHDARAALEGLVSGYLQHGPVLCALADAAATDARVDRAYRGMVEDFISATARHIRTEQARGRSPQADPERVVDVLLHIWMSTLYGKTIA
jgi:AcrR family transcriptional regulator